MPWEHGPAQGKYFLTGIGIPIIQGSHGSGKTWKVREYQNDAPGPGKVQEIYNLTQSPWKVCENMSTQWRSQMTFCFGSSPKEFTTRFVIG